MAGYHGLDIGMQVLYGVQNGEFPGAEHSYYPALIVGIRPVEMGPPNFDIVVFTEVGVFSKTNVEDGGPNSIQAGKITMTSRQYDREVVADVLGLNFSFFRP